jgi:hypothetical protein
MDPAITVLALRGTAGIAHALPGPQRILMKLMSTWEEVGADIATLARPGNSQMRLGLMTVQTARPEHFRLKVGRRTATIALGHLRGPRVALLLIRPKIHQQGLHARSIPAPRPVKESQAVHGRHLTILVPTIPTGFRGPTTGCAMNPMIAN